MRVHARRSLLLLVLVAAALAPTVAGAASPASGAKPAIVLRTGIGRVLATPGKLGLYYWTVEKKAGGRIRCTGSCAVAWPPVFVNGVVPRHVKGIGATFGAIKRGSRRQLTVNGLPAYTYEHDTPGIVLCDNVDGWFAVRPR